MSAQALDHTSDRWFLHPDERGNPDTAIDRGRGVGYTTGNHVEVLIDGETYFERLFRELTELVPGDRVLFTDWRSDPDERLAGAGSEVAHVLATLPPRGVDVRGLMWRSHVDRLRFSERENRTVSQVVNEAGGEVLLDERVRSFGSHHQKLVVLERATGVDSAFVGGIDLSRGRHDSSEHHGDPQAVTLDDRYGPRPPWHDMQLRVEGPAVADLAHSFRERWNDPTPLDHHVPWRMLLARRAHEPRHWQALPARTVAHPRPGSHAVQVLRTYPRKRRPYPFARNGERSVARAYVKAFARAQSLVYIEDQYFWSRDAADALHDALRRAPDLHVVVILPAIPDRDRGIEAAPNRIGQVDAVARVRSAAPERVAVYSLESEHGVPIYVHAKVCIVDDVWVTVGSDNLNRRSWTNDAELCCAVIDEQRDDRSPRDPGGSGDGARVFARETRLRLWREHLQDDPDDLIDPHTGFGRLAAAAAALDAWHRAGCRGPRPPGRLRRHEPEPVRATTRPFARGFSRVFVDPDGRPRALRRANRF